MTGSQGKHRRRRQSSIERAGSPSFGGWQSYQEWADHEFLPRPPQPEPEGPVLRLETLVASARPLGDWGDAEVNREHRAICTFCSTPRSVAEVCAYINAPIGVTRLLISYAVALGLLVVHRNAREATAGQYGNLANPHARGYPRQ